MPKQLFIIHMSIEHCQWGDWGSCQYDNQVEVDGKVTKCGNGKKTRSEEKPAKHGGNDCEGAREDPSCPTITCPGMNFI